MLVTVDEAKLYLRLDGTEEDALIQTLLETAESLCQDIVRTDFDEMEEVPEIVKVGIRYAVTYLYENREKADFDELTRMLTVCGRRNSDAGRKDEIPHRNTGL